MQRRRPTGTPQNPWQGGRSPYQRPLEEQSIYQDPPYEEQPYDEPYYDEQPYEEAYDEPYDEPQPVVIATNTAIRLTCTLCAMCGVLAIFMCWAEKESRAIRHFAVQSAALTALHVLCAVLLLLISGLMGGVPFLGFLMKAVCWLLYITALIAMVVVRARMMLHAWRGIRFELPGLWRALERFC